MLRTLARRVESSTPCLRRILRKYRTSKNQLLRNQSLHSQAHQPWTAPTCSPTSSTSATPAPYKIDILISELLGSFADNELSPECLDGVQHLLNPVQRHLNTIKLYRTYHPYRGAQTTRRHHERDGSVESPSGRNTLCGHVERNRLSEHRH